MELTGLFLFELAPLAGREEEALALLAAQRREKALRLPPGPRLRSLGAGLLLRAAFGSRTYETGEQGKPYFPGGPCFSLSHSGGVALLAVAPFPIGADAGEIAPVRAAVLPRVLSEEERCWMEAGDPEERFAFLWTRKEAALKCRGCGITRPMRGVSALPEQCAAVDGKTYALHSELWHTTAGARYMLSTAGEEGTLLPLTVCSAEKLLSQEEPIWNC